MLWSKTQTNETPLNQTECLLSPLLFYGKSGSAVTKNIRYSDRPARMIRAILRSDVRINPLGDISLKNQGPSPIGRQAARITFLLSREPQNCDVLAMCRAASCTD